MQKVLIFFSILLFSCGQSDHNTKKSKTDTKNQTKINSTTLNFTLKDTTIKVVWREDRYDSTLKGTFNTIILNDKYFTHISEPEKAAIAYVATFVGSECNWDGEANDSFSNLNCKVIKALRLGYQCSNKHLNFLRHWFRNDTSFLKKLDDCPITPYTATHQNTFDNLTIKTNIDSIKISYEASWTDGPESDYGSWTENLLFKVEKDILILLNKKTKNSKPEPNKQSY